MKTTIFTILFIFYAPYSYSAEAETTKEIWKQLMIMQLPGVLCSKNTYFSSCAEFTNDTCAKLMSRATEVCFNNLDSKIPNIINKQSGAKWGGYIGECAGIAYMRTATSFDKKSKLPSCINYGVWVNTQKASNEQG